MFLDKELGVLEKRLHRISFLFRGLKIHRNRTFLQCITAHKKGQREHATKLEIIALTW